MSTFPPLDPATTMRIFVCGNPFLAFSHAGVCIEW
jgi:hypothetical protein